MSPQEKSAVPWLMVCAWNCKKRKKRNFSAYRKATKIKCRTGFNNYKSVNQQIKRSKNNNYWKDRFCVCVTGPTCNAATQRKRERAFHHKFL